MSLLVFPLVAMSIFSFVWNSCHPYCPHSFDSPWFLFWTIWCMTWLPISSNKSDESCIVSLVHLRMNLSNFALFMKSLLPLLWRQANSSPFDWLHQITCTNFSFVSKLYPMRSITQHRQWVFSIFWWPIVIIFVFILTSNFGRTNRKL